MRSSVQMVMLTAPDVRLAADFYVEHLGFRLAHANHEEAIVDAYGMQLVFSIGPGGTHSNAPEPAQAVLELPATMQRIEALWDRDREADPLVTGPMLDPSGAFIYVTLDPARNAIALVSPLPSARDDVPRERVTQRLRRPDFE